MINWINSAVKYAVENNVSVDWGGHRNGLDLIVGNCAHYMTLKGRKDSRALD